MGKVRSCVYADGHNYNNNNMYVSEFVFFSLSVPARLGGGGKQTGKKYKTTFFPVPTSTSTCKSLARNSYTREETYTAPRRFILVCVDVRVRVWVYIGIK